MFALALVFHALTTQLFFGPDAAPQRPISILWQEAEEFDGLSKTAIISKRTQALKKYTELYRLPYQPKPEVFGGIVDGMPWWGTYGKFIYGPGKQSTQGKSEQSLALLNPYHLVLIDCDGLSIYGGLVWDLSKVAAATSEDLIPMHCLPQSLIVDPRKSEATATYNITQYMNELEPWVKTKFNRHQSLISLDPLNALDLGFVEMKIDWKNSKEFFQDEKMRAPDKIPLIQFIHLGGSCGQPGGCNNMSPYVKELDEIQYKNLPAELHLILRDKRGSEFHFNIFLK